MTIDTTTGLPYTGDAPRAAADPLAGLIPGRSIGRCGISSFKAPGDARFPGEGASAPPPSISPPSPTSTVYTTPYAPPGPVPTSTVYTPRVGPPVAPAPGPVRFVPPEETWIPGVPNVVTGVAAVALGYALYKTFFEAPSRENPSAPHVQGFLARHGLMNNSVSLYPGFVRGEERVSVEGLSATAKDWILSKTGRAAARKEGIGIGESYDGRAVVMLPPKNARKNPADDSWAKIERRLGSQFILWATPADGWSRYAVVRPERFSGLRWYRYNASGDLIGQSAGAFYDTGDPKDHPEGAVEWTRRSAIKAAQKAEALARSNPNNKGKPTLKEVEEAFGESLRHEYGDKAAARAREIHAALNSDGYAGAGLHAVNRIIRGHGVEQFPQGGDGGADAIYINTGDLYNMTAIYDVKRRAYVLTDMGTWRSENES